MAAPPVPPPFDQFADRRFSFYPALVNVEHNEWTLKRSTWSEVLVCNTKTGEDIWIPRRFVGEVSRTDEPVMIVGLLKELEYKAGQVIPYVRRVIEMPRAVNEGYRPPGTPAEPAIPSHPPGGLRLESGTEQRVGKLLLWVLGAGVIACLALLIILRVDRDPRIRYNTVMQSELGLNGGDDYHGVLRKLGAPASDRWLSEQGEMQYRILHYPQRGVSVVLMGSERDKAVYIGAVDSTWRPVDAIALPGGKDTRAMLRALKPK
jgi:hypothetical protein